MGHNSIYEWKILKKDGSIVTSDGKILSNVNHSEIESILFYPFTYRFPSIYYKTEGRKIIHFTRVFCNITNGEVDRVLYVFGVDGDDIDVIEYPSGNSYKVKRIEDIDNV